jgi:dTDP-4-dehydrorhamnose reductase
VALAITDVRPDVIFNAAAYTATDHAENDEPRAYAVNKTGVGILARNAAKAGARLVHVSTDFVFDGERGRPYRPDDETAPLSAYGRTKLAGEYEAIVSANALIVRSSWVYAARGSNFVRTMLRLMSERERLGVVADQIGSPTEAGSLADALWQLAAKRATGIHHYSDSGVASWYDFAVAIQEEAIKTGLLDRVIPIDPISAADYPTAAARPSYSVLDTRSTIALLGKAPLHWRVNLRRMLEELKSND